MLHTKNARILPSGFLIATFQEIVALLFRLLLRFSGGYKVNYQIMGRLGHRQRYILAANHQSLVDPFAIFSLFTMRHRFQFLPIKFMTIPKVYHRWYIKPFAYLLGCFPAHIKERNHHTYGIEGAIKLLHYGYNICIFPEGTRTLRSESDPKPGIVKIMQEYPDAKLLLAHIEWKYTGWRRSVSVTIAHAPENLDTTDPKAIMDAIYAL
jgi:1-acyl-sn-glycerol-3-phosphate acyltransferase